MSASRRIRESSARIPSWVLTSRAVVGSSAIRSRGRWTNAIARAIRWFIPPLSWNG